MTNNVNSKNTDLSWITSYCIKWYKAVCV